MVPSKLSISPAALPVGDANTKNSVSKRIILNIPIPLFPNNKKDKPPLKATWLLITV
jgi:hypothetical protein